MLIADFFFLVLRPWVTSFLPRGLQWICPTGVQVCQEVLIPPDYGVAKALGSVPASLFDWESSKEGKEVWAEWVLTVHSYSPPFCSWKVQRATSGIHCLSSAAKGRLCL